jgi:hypothetical protein
MTKRENPVGGDTPADPLLFQSEPEPNGTEPSAAEPSGADPTEPEPTGPERGEADPDVEIVDGLPVLAEVRTIERSSPASLATVQVAAVAATGFVAGAATVALVKRRAARKTARNGRNGSRRAADLLPIAASRSFLVDVHVISKPE